MDPRISQAMMTRIEETARREAPAMAQDLHSAARNTGSINSAVVRFFGRMDSALKPLDAPYACSAGCDYCCFYRVVASAPEIFALVTHIGSWPDERQREMVGKLQAYVAQTSTMTTAQHEATNIACAFLDGSRCSVYPLRPLACRRHHSVDARPCKAAFDHPHNAPQILTVAEHMAIAHGFSSAQYLAQHSAGVDQHAYELHAALLEAITNPASLKRWKSGKTSFPTVKDKELPGN